MKKTSLFFIVCILFCFFFCDKHEDDEPGSNDGPPVSGENIPFEDVQALYQEIDTKILAEYESGSSITDIVSRVGSMLESHALVSHVSTVTEEAVMQVAFQMTNGMIVLIPFIPENMKGVSSAEDITDTEKGAQGQRAVGKARTNKKQSLTQVLPVQNPPCAVFGTLKDFITPAGEKDFGPEFSALAKKHGWNADYGNYDMNDKYGNRYMGVEFFKTLHEYSLVYLGTHGYWTNSLGSGASYFLMETDDTCTFELHNIFWKNGDFMYQRVGTTNPWIYSGHSSEPNFIEFPGYHYAVSQHFINEYCGGFPDNSLVILDMCMGMSGDRPLVDILVEKNVSEVLGWTDVVHWGAGAGVTRYLLTHLFGEITDDLTGCITAGSTECYCTEQAKPPFRPFGFIESFEAIGEKGWDVDNKYPDSPGAFFLCYPVQGDASSAHIELNLIPSIYGMYYDFDVVTGEKFLTLHGNFGENKGKVTLDGKEVSCEWEHDEIVADLQGADGGGPVVVEYNGLKSNPHPLTYWEGSMKVSGSLGDSQPEIEECEVTFQFRTEIVDERPDPEADPDPQLAHNGGFVEGSSQVNASMTGSFELLDCLYNFDIPGNKGKVINVGVSADQTFVGSILVEDGKAKFAISVAWNGKVEKTCPPDPPEIKDFWMAIPLFFETEINEDGTIPANTVTSGGLIIEIENDIEPDSPPTEDTQR